MALRSVAFKSLPKGGMTDVGPRGRVVDSNLDSINDTGLVVMFGSTKVVYP